MFQAALSTAPRALAATVLAGLLAACGGGDAPAQPSPAGVYGRDTAPLIVAADGSFIGFAGGFMGQVAGANYVVYSGKLGANGTALTATDARVGQTFSAISVPPTTTVSTSRVEGSFIEGVSLTRDIAVEMRIAMDPATLPFYTDATYRSASLQTVAGSYTTPAGALSITSAGTLQGSAFGTDCVIAGSVRVLAAERNVYSITATLTGSTCPGTPGRSYAMLGYLASSPVHHLTVMADLDGQQGSFAATRN